MKKIINLKYILMAMGVHLFSLPLHAEYVFNKEEKLKALSSQQIAVTQESATEKPFDNAYWDLYQPGIYVDIISGEPLFSSTHKYKSNTGWPSFTQPINKAFIIFKQDNHLIFFKRTEVRSKLADSHLGHVFKDGPPPTGLRYCVNSAALRFIPKKEMKAEGYGEYLYLFDSQSNKEEPR